MITKSNNPLTEDEIAKYNAVIADFIKKNSNYVNYSELDDGNTYITLQYGMVRNSALREIANRCRTSLTDDVFKIGTLNCTIKFATSGVLRFVGKTAEIHAELPNLDKETYGELIKKTSSEINLPTTLTADISSLASTIATFATLSDSKLAEMGIATSTIGNKKHISFDVSKIEKYATKNPSNEQAVALNNAISSVIGAYKEFPKATLTKISESLSSAGLELERLNGSVIMLSLGIAKPGDGNDPSGTTDEFVYEKVPYSSKYMILHYGNPEFTPASADLFDVVVIREMTKEYYTGSPTWTVEMPLFVLVNKKDKSIIAADYAYPWIVNPECTLDDSDYDVGSKELLTVEDGNDERYYNIMGTYEQPDWNGRANYDQKIENILAPAKERYFNAVVSQFKKVATDHKILVKFTSPAVGEGDNVYLNNVVVNTLRKCISNEENLISSKDRTQLLDYIKNYMAKIRWGSESDVAVFNDASVMSWLNNLDSSNYDGKDRSYADTPLIFAIGNSDDTTITEMPTSSGDSGPCYPADILDVYCGNSNIAGGGFGNNLCESTELTEDYAREYIAEALNDGEGTCRMTSQLRFGDNIIRAAYKTGRAIDIYFMK